MIVLIYDSIQSTCHDPCHTLPTQRVTAMTWPTTEATSQIWKFYNHPCVRDGYYSLALKTLRSETEVEPYLVSKRTK